MDPLTLALQAVNTGLRIFEIILTDIPKENRVQAWRDWYAFVDKVMAPLKGAK